MAEIKLVENYAVTQLRNDVRDSLQMAGEQAILLQLYHPGDPDAVPCPQCGDDIYKSPEADCNSCYGTMFEGGVRTAMLVWALFTDNTNAEQLGPRGAWRPDNRSVQFEAFPLVDEHDVIVRVRQWAAQGTPAVLEGYYMLQAVTQRSLRTGNRFGQFNWDTVAQKAAVAELNGVTKAIVNYPILGKTFTESVQLTQATATLPAQAVVMPDTKVIYFPFEVAPGGEVPNTDLIGSGQGDVAYVYTQDLPASVWTIEHTLGHNPSVSIIIDGEEVDGDVDYPNTSTVVVDVGTPKVGIARLT
jgi:hypothetical protein